MNKIKQLINVLNRADIFPDSEELADALWLALQMGNLTTQEKTVINEKKIDPNKEKEAENSPPLENEKPPKTPENNPPQSLSTESKEQPKKSPLYPYKQNSGGINSEVKGQAFRTPALPILHNALAFNRALRPLRKKIESRFHDELDIEKTVQNIAEIHLFLPILKGKSEHWLELVIVIDNAISMQIWQPLLKEFCRLLELQGMFKKIYFYQLDTENKEVKILNKNKRLIKNIEIINLHQSRLIWLLSDCVGKAWHSNEKGVFQLLQYWSRFHPVSIIQMLPYRLWKGTALGYAEEARFFATLSLGLNQYLTLKEKDFWFFEEDELKNLKKGFKIPILTLEPDIINSWVKLILGKKDHWLKGIVFDNQTTFISPLETEQPKNTLEITAEQRIKQFRSFASPTAQKLAAYLASVPLDLSVMNVVQKLMLPESQQIHLAEVFLGGLLKREQNKDWVEYEFHEGVRDLLLDTVILADAVYILTRVSDFVEKHIGKNLDFLALLANPCLTEGIKLNKETRPFAEIGAKILRRLGGKYEALAKILEGKTTIIGGNISKIKPSDCTFKKENGIQIYYRYGGFMPEAIFKQLITNLYHLVPNNHTCVWSTGVIFKQDKEQAQVLLLKNENNYEIEVYVNGIGAALHDIPLLTLILYELDEANILFNQNNQLQFDKLIFCQCEKFKDNPEIFSIKQLKEAVDNNIPYIKCSKYSCDKQINTSALLDGLSGTFTQELYKNYILLQEKIRSVEKEDQIEYYIYKKCYLVHTIDNLKNVRIKLEDQIDTIESALYFEFDQNFKELVDISQNNAINLNSEVVQLQMRITDLEKELILNVYTDEYFNLLNNLKTAIIELQSANQYYHYKFPQSEENKILLKKIITLLEQTIDFETRNEEIFRLKYMVKELKKISINNLFLDDIFLKLEEPQLEKQIIDLERMLILESDSFKFFSTKEKLINTIINYKKVNAGYHYTFPQLQENGLLFNEKVITLETNLTLLLDEKSRHADDIFYLKYKLKNFINIFKNNFYLDIFNTKTTEQILKEKIIFLEKHLILETRVDIILYLNVKLDQLAITLKSTQNSYNYSFPQSEENRLLLEEKISFLKEKEREAKIQHEVGEHFRLQYAILECEKLKRNER
jgi:hypothetical protein